MKNLIAIALILLSFPAFSQTDSTFYFSLSGIQRSLTMAQLRTLVGGSGGGGSEATTVSDGQGVGLTLSGTNITPRLGGTYMLNHPTRFTAGRKLNWGDFTTYIGSNTDSTAFQFDIANNRLGIGGTASPAHAIDMVGNLRVQSGTIIGASGTDAAPFYSFSSSSSTGFRYDGGNIGVSTGGTRRLTIGAAGLSVMNSTTAATAKITIGNSTGAAGTAPLKFSLTSHTQLTTPEAGVLEPITNGSRLRYTNASATANELAFVSDVPDNISDLTISADVDLSNQKITNLANGTASSDAATYGQLTASHALDLIAGVDGDTIVLDTRETLLALDGGFGDPATFYIDGSALGSGAKIYIKYVGFPSGATLDRDDDNDPGNFIAVGAGSGGGTTTLSFTGTGTSMLLKSGSTWYQMY